MSLARAPSLKQLDAHEARCVALDYVSEAFAEAMLDGVDVEAFADAAVSAVLRELVAANGEDRVAEFVKALPERIRAGEFSSRLRQ
jgi:hypothetical protein